MSIITEKETLRDAALSYASRGWAVFPLRGKLPAIAKKDGGSGYLDATTNIQQITEWLNRYPNANIGIATRASGLIVVDVDPRKGGDEHLLALESQYRPLPDSVESITGSDGRHVYFKAPADDRVQRKTNALGQGIDLPNYVVAPPSIHPETRRPYLWEASSHPDDILLAPAPDWLLKIAAPKRGTTGHMYPGFGESSASWESILVPHGWVRVQQEGEVTRWRRPGKDDGWSATTDYIPGRLFLFTTSGAPLEAGRPYSKVETLVALNNVSHQNAARELGIRLPYRMASLGLPSLRAATRPAPPVCRGHL